MMREDWVELGQVIEVARGGSPRPIKAFITNENNGINWIKIGDAKPQSKYIVSTNQKIKPEGVNKTRLVYEGDLLLSNSMSFGRPYILKVNGAIHDGWLVLSNKHVVGLDKEFIFYALSSPVVFTQFDQLAKGSTVKNLNTDIVEKVKIPIFPLPEQRAIVAKIEQLFSELDNGISNLKKAKEKLEIYRHAVLKKAFEGDLTDDWRKKNQYTMEYFLSNLKKEKENAIKSKLISSSNYFPEFKEDDLTYRTPENWVTLPWKTITKNNKYAMKRGPFGSALKKEFFVDKGVVVYEQGHAINDDPYRHRYFITEKKFEELKAFEVKGGDMIISCSGVTLGRICLLPEDADLGIINQALLKIDLDENIMLKKFFVLLFRSETFQRLIFKKSLGTAMPNMVGMPELKEIPIPIPSIQEQQQIIKEIETRLSVCDNILSNIDDSLEKAGALRQSILKKGFEGMLLSKDELEACRKESDWEPVEKILEKIK